MEKGKISKKSGYTFRFHLLLGKLGVFGMAEEIFDFG
jgi:hypothetical protein